MLQPRYRYQMHLMLLLVFACGSFAQIPSILGPPVSIHTQPHTFKTIPIGTKPFQTATVSPPKSTCPEGTPADAVGSNICPHYLEKNLCCVGGSNICATTCCNVPCTEISTLGMFELLDVGCYSAPVCVCVFSVLFPCILLVLVLVLLFSWLL